MILEIYIVINIKCFILIIMKFLLDELMLLKDLINNFRLIIYLIN